MEAEVLGQISHPPPRFRVAGRLAKDARLTACGRYQAKQDLDGRRLDGAVRSQEAENFTRLDREVQPVKRDLAAVLLAESDRFDGRCQLRTARELAIF